MLKMSYAGCPGQSSSISVQFTFKMSDATGNRQKFTKTLFWRFNVIKSHRRWHQ